MTHPAALILIAALALAACGKQGELERPPPIFGGGVPAQPPADKPAQ